MISFRDRPRPNSNVIVLLLSCGFAVFLALYHLAFYKPAAQRVTRLQAEALQRERTLSLSTRLAGQHPGVLQRLRANDATAVRLGLSNPTVELLTRVAKELDLDVELIEPGLVEVVGPRMITPIALNLTGGYTDFARWVRAVEASDVLATVDRVRMEASPTGRHAFVVHLSTYAYAGKE